MAINPIPRDNFQLVVLFSLLTFCGTVNAQDPLQTFLTAAMQDFPAWLQFHGFEPLPFDAKLIPFSGISHTWNISGAIHPQGIIRHSDFRPLVSASLNGDLWVEVEVQLEIVGEYNLTGVFESVPVEGEGKLSLKDYVNAVPGLQSQALFSAYDFRVNSEGFIDLSTGSDLVHSTLFNQPSLTLEGLSAGGHDGTIKAIVRQNLHSIKLNLHNYIKQFVTDLLGKVPVSEIIEFTIPPSSSTEIPINSTEITALPNITTTTETPRTTPKDDDWTVVWLLKKIQITKWIFAQKKSNSTLLMSDKDDSSE